jgi:hypothetical protein
MFALVDGYEFPVNTVASVEADEKTCLLAAC